MTFRVSAFYSSRRSLNPEKVQLKSPFFLLTRHYQDLFDLESAKDNSVYYEVIV